MNTYTEAIGYLYSRLPMFTRDGASAYKKDLDRTLALCAAVGNPQHAYKTIHVAGTNGKGSSAHMLAAILASAGYRTGLYTSPHLVDFRERIRINGQFIDEQSVIDYVNDQRHLIEEIQPSFFEATVALAFNYFAQQNVDIAVIEVGLGGRLDSTNIIFPEVSLITNIGMDHMNILGTTLEEIAFEKAGIIKGNIPVVISESNSLIDPVFKDVAEQRHAPILFADQKYKTIAKDRTSTNQTFEIWNRDSFREVSLDLTGIYQRKNILGVLAVVDLLREKGYSIPDKDLHEALANVQSLTGLQGRWQTLSTDPLIICDTGHNEDGIKEVLINLQHVRYDQLHIVIGAMRDKDLDHILSHLPKDAKYYFCHPNIPRAMPAEQLAHKAESFDLHGKVSGEVGQALKEAKASYKDGDLIFIGGSNFVVAEVLAQL